MTEGILMANKIVVLAIFTDEAAADSAAKTVKDSGLARHDAIGVLVLNEAGQAGGSAVEGRASACPGQPQRRQGRGQSAWTALRAARARLAKRTAVTAKLAELGGATQSRTATDEALEEANAAAGARCLVTVGNAAHLLRVLANRPAEVNICARRIRVVAGLVVGERSPEPVIVGLMGRFHGSDRAAARTHPSGSTQAPVGGLDYALPDLVWEGRASSMVGGDIGGDSPRVQLAYFGLGSWISRCEEVW